MCYTSRRVNAGSTYYSTTTKRHLSQNSDIQLQPARLLFLHFLSHKVPSCSLRWYHCSFKWTTRLGILPAIYLVDETILYQVIITNRVLGSEMIVSECNLSQDWPRRGVGRLQSWGIKKCKKMSSRNFQILCNGKVTQKILWFPEKVDQLLPFRLYKWFQHKFWLYNSVQSNLCTKPEISLK